MRFVYQVFCIVGWSWAVVVAVALGVLSRRRPTTADERQRGFEVGPRGEGEYASRAGRESTADPLPVKSLKEA